MAWLSYLRRLHQESKPVPEWRTSHGLRSENSLKPLRKRSQMVKTYSKHKNEPFQGRNMQERNGNRRRRSIRATILAIWRTTVWVSGGIYRPQVLKLKMRMTRTDSDTASYLLPASGQCVGVSVLTNRLRQTHARGGHWFWVVLF